VLVFRSVNIAPQNAGGIPNFLFKADFGAVMTRHSAAFLPAL
jgi:hypothetical protein